MFCKLRGLHTKTDDPYTIINFSVFYLFFVSVLIDSDREYETQIHVQRHTQTLESNRFVSGLDQPLINFVWTGCILVLVYWYKSCILVSKTGI